MTIPRPIGFPLLPVPDADGRLRWPSLEESVAQSIRVLLATRPGERVMRPTFGVGLDRFVNEPDTVTTRARIRESILDGLGKWEPRITVDRVETSDVPGEPGTVRVEIEYRLRRTGSSHRLGLALRTGV
jgi:phage baseplate assembly protein W